MATKTAAQKVNDVLARLEKHEAECAVRYEMINKQLDEGNKRFDKLERLVMSIYPFIVISIVASSYL
tara:strand:+ start:622 stop:822 length:201 start_codon:yes stop_codon:yes gene_type:complete